MILRWHQTFIRVLASLQSPFLLVIRLYWGWQFIITGKGKLENIPKIIEFFKSLGIPLAGLNAYLVGTTELVGGSLLLLGLGARLTAIPLIIAMTVAYLTADLDATKALFSEPNLFAQAAPFPFLMTSLIVLIFGPGMFSVDTLIGRILKRKHH
ncbi:MAG: DoxX family protein [Deltaproteobacteria bacterium]|nr:DoxX family protein [Deltaproteobacteria bacterium]